METLTSKDFDEKTANGKVLVKFEAGFCSPCRLVQSKYVDWSNHHPEVTCYKVDCEESTDLVKKYGVKNIPAFALFEDGVFQSLTEKVRDFDKVIAGEPQ